METFRFLNFSVYIQAKQFYKGIIVLCEKIQKHYTLKDQILRAALSVILNIAEGSAKRSDKEFARFLETSIASMNEVVSCLDVMCGIGIVNNEVKEKFLIEAESIVKQLGGFIKKLYLKS